MLALGHKENLERLHHELISKDWFMTLLDFNDYVEKKDQALAELRRQKNMGKERCWLILQKPDSSLLTELSNSTTTISGT